MPQLLTRPAFWLAAYLVLMNLVTFWVYGADKRRARRGRGGVAARGGHPDPQPQGKRLPGGPGGGRGGTPPGPPVGRWMYPPTISTMRIDRIEPSRRRKDRVLVFLEGGDLLRVTEQELLVFGLRPGLELPEQLLAQVEQSAKRSEMKARGARLTGSRMLSKKQVMEHLTRKGGDRELAEDTAQWLEELGAVDESAYAAAIARHYAAMGYGPGRVRQELQQQPEQHQRQSPPRRRCKQRH